MENKPMVARFMVYRVGSFVVKERVLCFGEYSFSTLDRENQQMTNTWPYEDVDGANALDGETDFVIHTPRHRIKKTVYRSQFRMDVLVCLLRLRSRHYAKTPNYSTPVGLQTHIFEGRKCYWSGMESPFVVEVRPDGIYQRDTEGDVMSCISYTSLVSMDVIGDDREAIVLNHADNSSLFFVPRRTELALAIERVMKAYGMQINKYGEKTMEMALKDGGFAATTMRTAVSFEYQVSKVSTSKESSGGAPRTLSVSEMYVTEYTDAHTVISCRPLSRVYSLIIYQDMVQTFRVVYVDGVSRTYNSYQREKIVCELLASCHALGNLQVSVEMVDIPEFMRMIPRELIREGSRIAHAVPNVNLTDRELRAVQANILQSLAVHGGRKTARTQRQLPRGLDEEMHSLAVEFNVNTPTYGVIAQPSKSYEKVLYILARELRDIVARHGANHDFVITYLQSLYRLMLAPAAINEFMKILTEREEEYFGTICKILDRKNSVATYWIFMVLSRLMESKEHKLQCLQLMLSNRVFLTTLLSLLDEDIRTGLFLSDLPTMKLCQLILLLVEGNDEKQPELAETLHQHLATKYRMLLRVLFSFPGLATVEACVGILSQMSKSVSCPQLGNVGHPVRSNGGKIQQALSFGPGSHRQAVAPQSNRPPTFSSRGNTYAANRSSIFSSSASSSGGLSGAPASVLVVQNPTVLLQQYRQFFEAAWGSLPMRLDQYDDPKFLRLRYRCRNTFLQELMSYLAGNFEEFKRVYKVDCYQFSGFIGTADGQRERTRFYLTPRGLISVRTASRHTQEFEYRSLKEIIEATAIMDAFILIVKGKLKFIYADESAKIVEKMKTLAGVVGIHLRVRTQEKLPKPPVEKPLDLSKFQSNDLFDVQRLTGRLGSTNLRKRKVCFVDGTIEEFTNCSKKVYDLKMLRRVVVPGSGGDDAQAVVVLEFLDCSRVTYVPYDTEKFLAAVYDGYRCVDNYNVSLSREFSSLNPRMSTRMLLRDEHERFLYCSHDGLYIPAHATLEKEFEMMNGEGVSIASATNRVAFALENLNMNVETCDFTKQSMRGRLEQLSFSHLLGGINNMLEYSCKPPIRTNDICVILEAFCRINDGCFRISMEQPNGGAMVVVPALARILVSGDPVATVWALDSLHSLVTYKSRSNGHRAAEKAIRSQVFDDKKLILLLADLLDQQNPSSTLAMLELVLDVLVVSRHSTDTVHFDAIVKALGAKYLLLLELASQTSNAGLAAAVICLLKVLVDHGHHKIRRRICDVALESGLTVKHLYKAFFHPADNARETYQYITSIWVTHHKASHEMFSRILPHGFIRMVSDPMVRKLLMKQRARKTESVRMRSKRQLLDQVDGSEWFIRRMQLQIGTLFDNEFRSESRGKEDSSHMNYCGESSTDIALLSSMVCKDFLLPDLIWNEQTRAELETALKLAIEEFDQHKLDQAAAISLLISRKGCREIKWNHAQFSVVYNSIAQELQVNRFYPRVIMKRINDGSLKLAEVANTARAMEAGTHVGNLTKSSSLFFASVGIAKNPAMFFNEVYQCWLEHLHLNNIPLSGTNDWSASGSNGFSRHVGALGSEQHGHSLLKILIELARVFPETRSVTKHRARFLTELLRNSYLVSEIQDIVELMSCVSLSGGASVALCTNSHIQVLLHMSMLLHRCPTEPLKSDTNTGQGDIPMMDSMTTSEYNESSSMPIAELSFYNDSRFALKWSIKCKNAGKTDEGSVINGPYSANELKEFIDADSLGRNRQFDAFNVCCCSVHEREHTDGAEHTWKSIFEYPELRWMEITDEPIDTNCAMFALKTLRNFMVKDQGTGPSGNTMLWPPPLVNTIMDNTSSLACIAQLLLVNNSSVRRYVCEMLMSLNEVELQEMYKYGVFYFILSTAANLKGSENVPAFLPEATLLQRMHRSQRSSERRVGQSYLIDILPESLISVLDSETPERFADMFSGRIHDKRVLWSSKMRIHLHEMMGEHLQEFKGYLKDDVAARYIYSPIPPISYLELSGDVYCSGFYLSTFNRCNSDEEEVENPVFLIKSVEEKWRYFARRQVGNTEETMDHLDACKIFGWSEDAANSLSDLRRRYRELCRQGIELNKVRRAFDSICAALERKNEADGGRTSDEVLEHILKSQLRLLDEYGFHFSSYESSTLDLLLNVLSSQLEGESKFGTLAMNVLQQLLYVAPQNGPLLVNIDGCWETILGLVERCAYGHDVASKESMFSILQLLLVSREGVESLVGGNFVASDKASPSKTFDFTVFRDDENTSFFTATEYTSLRGPIRTRHAQSVYSLLDDVILSFENIQPWHIQKMSFDIASSLCRSRAVQEQIMTSTRVFWKGLYLILASAESTSGIDTAQEGTTVLEKQELEMLESAFGALRSLALGPEGNSRSAGLDALANLLPMDFLNCLEKPNGHDFCTTLLSNIREPTCIWNESTRAELSELTEEFCTDSNGDMLSFLEIASNHMYDCLSTEPFVGGIYLLILLEKSEVNPTAINEDTLYPTTAVDFVESLFLFLNENRDPKLGIYSDTLPALDCLSLLCDLPAFRPAIVECLEQHVDDVDPVNASVSVATLGRYLLPFDGGVKSKAVSISSRRSLSTYGFDAKNGYDLTTAAMETDFGNVDYLARQELALLVLNKICGFGCNLERMLAPFCQFTWCLQVITDHLDYEQAFYALSCLAELCDTCLAIAEYIEMSGLWVEVLGIALQSRQHVLHEHFLRAEALREPAFEVLYALLMKDVPLREKMYRALCRFLPYPIVYQIHLDPNKATRFFDDNHEKSDLIWNSHRRTEVRKKLDAIICRNRVERSIAKRDSVLLDDETDFIPLPQNFVAGLYIDRFLSRPDPEKLTNPAYNLELLFQVWRTQLDKLMGFDLQNPPDDLQSIVDEIDRYTIAITHILRASLDIDENVANDSIPEQIVKLVRHCNQHLVTSFPYRCILRVARRLVQFPEITSKEFVELLICRITLKHPDIPNILKVLRRVLEARNTALAECETKEDPDYWLRDLKYYPQMLAFLEGLVENKDEIETSLLSNANRVLRIIHAEEPKETHVKQFSRSLMGRWHNFTLESRTSTLRNTSITGQVEMKPPAHASAVNTKSANPDALSALNVNVDEASERLSEIAASTRSFDVDGEREPSIRVDIKGTPDDREIDIDGTFIQTPPKSINYTDGAVEVGDATIAPRSFQYKGEYARDSPLPSPTSLRYSTLGARYEPINSQYHSRKAAEYDEHEDDEDIFATRPRRGSVPSKVENVSVMGTNRLTVDTAGGGGIPMSSINVSIYDSQAPATHRQSRAPSGVPPEATGSMSTDRRYSLLDSWKPPSSVAPSSSLTSLTISRRGRRAAAVYSRCKSKGKKKWFNR